MTPDGSHPVRPVLNPGDKVSYFSVTEPLAAGGMALVWKGYDGLLGRNVAIKQIAAGEAADEAAREAFRREAEIQKHVSASHNNLVSVHEFVEDERGLFIVMEYVDGPSLEQKLSQLDGPLPPRQALNIIHQVAIGLAAIHHGGVIHRDLKPSNILLPKEGGVKICDFGIATPAEDQDLLNLGTARYMAPEMFTEEEVDARADLYGLGMIAYEMLAGRPAFEDAFKVVLRDKRNQSLRWMKWHTNQRVAAPPLAKLNLNLPQPLVELVERLMAKDRDQRIGSAVQLIDVLKRNFSGQRAAHGAAAGAAAAPHDPATAPQAASNPTAPLPKRSKVGVILAIVLGLQVLGVGGYFGYQRWQDAQESQSIQQQALDTYRAARQAYDEGEPEDLVFAAERFKTLSEDDQWRGHPVLDTAAAARFQLIAGRWKADQAHELTKELKFESAIDKYRDAQRHFDKALEQALRLNMDGVGKFVDEIKKHEARAREAQAFPEAAMQIAQLLDEDNFVTARRRITELRDEMELVEAEEAIRQELRNRIEAQASRQVVDNLVAKAQRLREEGRLEQALETIRQAQDEEEKRDFTDGRLDNIAGELRRTIEYENAMAAAQRAENAGNLSQAIAQYRRAQRLEPKQRIEEKVTGLQSELAYRQGREAERNGNLDRARQLYIESNTIQPNRQAEQGLARIGQAEDYQSLVQLGNQKFSGEAYETAIDAWQKAIAMAGDAGDRQRLQSKITEARVRLNVQKAREAMSRGDYETASAHINTALGHDARDSTARRLREDLDLIQSYNALLAQGDEARRQGRFAQAKRHYREAIKLVEGTSIDPAEPEQRLVDAEYESLLAQSRSYIELRQWDQAKALLEIAQSKRNTPVVKELLSEVNKHIPSG